MTIKLTELIEAVEFSDEEKRIANSTARNWKKIILTDYVKKLAKLNQKIIDFGAGPEAIHTFTLRDHGYDVTAHEFGSNFNDEYHDPRALSKKYDVVMGSNLINVQCSEVMLHRTLQQINSVMKANGFAVVNYPKDPRKCVSKKYPNGMSQEDMHSELTKVFNVEVVDIRHGTVIWKLTKKGGAGKKTSKKVAKKTTKKKTKKK